MKAIRRGRLVALEGIDGVGKTRVLGSLRRRLADRGLSVRTWKEPSRKLEEILRRRDLSRDPGALALLFTTDRLVRRPELERLLSRSDIVLSDRSFFSTLAYQGPGLSSPARQDLERMQRELARAPDLVLWLDLPVSVALRRIQGRSRTRSTFESGPNLERTRRAYQALARDPRNRFVRLDASRTPGETAEDAWKVVWENLRPRRTSAGAAVRDTAGRGTGQA